MENIMITGASGYIGQRLARELSRNVAVKKIFGIDIQPPRENISKFIFIRRDVREPVNDLLKEHRIDVVIHTAFILPPIHNTKLMEDININGTRNILSASLEAGVSQFIYTSSTTAYGFHPENICPLIEESPLRGNDDLIYCKTKREIESFIKNQDLSVRYPDTAVTILRACFVVGPGFNNPLARYLQKRVVFLPRNTKPLQYVHEDDLIRAICLLMEKKAAGIYNVAADGLMSFEEMVSILGNRTIYIPFFVMYYLNQIAWSLRITFLSEFPSPNMNMLRYPWWAENKKLKTELGFNYQYTTEEAFRDFAAHVQKLKKQGIRSTSN
jgi:UDP-glucose 4-epimerase